MLVDDQHLAAGPCRPARLLRRVATPGAAGDRPASRGGGADPASTPQAVVVAGGHVGELTRVLHLFCVEPHLPQVVIAWSAGAMALSERVVLFHDFVPHGVAQTEVFERGARRGSRSRAAPAHASSAACRRPGPHVGAGATVRPCAMPGPGRRRARATSRPKADSRRCARRVRGRPGHRRRCGMNELATGVSRRRLAINRLKDRKPLDAAAVDRFLARHEVPIVEGSRCTFLFRGEADEVFVVQRIVGLPELCRCGGCGEPTCGTSCSSFPKGRGSNYQLEIRRGDHRRADQRPAQREALVQPGRQPRPSASDTGTSRPSGRCRIPRPGPASWCR